MTEFFSILGLALSGAAIVVLAIHFSLKIFRPEIFKGVEPRREREEGMRRQLRAATQPQVGQVPVAISDSMVLWWAGNLHAIGISGQRAQSTVGSVLAPTGQARRGEPAAGSLGTPSEQQLLGAAHAAQLGASS